MKLLHASDLHLDLRRPGDVPDPRDGRSSTLVDLERCLNHVADKAIEEHVDVVLISGDIFDNRNPSTQALAVFRCFINRLANAAIKVILILGNHDGPGHPGQAAAIQLFSRAGVWVVTRPAIVDINGFRIACLPWVSRQQMLAGGWGRDVSDERMIDGLCQIIDGFRAEGADVLTGHWSVNGSVLGTERDIAITGERMLSPTDLEGPWSYVGMGHIHKEQAIGIHGSRGAYAGSIDRCNFGEEHDRKGVLLVDMDDQAKAPELLETPARRFVTLAGSDLELLRAGLLDLDSAIVRVKLQLTEDEARGIDSAELRKDVMGRGAASCTINLDIKRDSRIRSEAMGADLSPLDALDLWFGANDFPDEKRDAVRDMARGLIEGAA